MYHTNDDDIEDLFRRAAEHYPLKTDQPNWDALAERLPATPVVESDTSGKSQRSRKALLLILLLIPGVWLCNKYSNKESTSKTTLIQPSESKLKADAAKRNNALVSVNNTVDRDKNENRTTGKFVSKPLERTIQTSSFEKVNNVTAFGNPRGAKPSPIKKDENDITRTIEATADHSGTEAQEGFKATTQGATAGSPGDTTVLAGQDQKKEDSLSNSLKAAFTGQNQQKAIKPFNKKQSGFLYAGLVAGVDLTTVKFQKVNNAGYAVGLLLGYQLNNKLSIESGLYFTNKYYYSVGQHFKSPYNTVSRKFINVTGDCKMLEIPINIKYNFASASKTAWFFTTGISSYFMQNEQYDYTYISWGQEYPGFYNNKKAATILFSAVNVSLGYQRHIGKSIIRIEPFAKVPLKGIGIGKLPLTSFGLNVGFTKRIW